MDVDAEENKRDSIRRGATLSAIVGPMVALMLAGFFARLQNFFCPANFLPLYAASFVLMAPGFYIIGLSGAETALRLFERGTARWTTFLILAIGGSILGALYFESLAFVLIRVAGLCALAHPPRIAGSARHSRRTGRHVGRPFRHAGAAGPELEIGPCFCH